MKTRIAENSLIANNQTNKTRDKDRIYNYLELHKDYPMTYTEIANDLGIPEKTVTARLNDLVYKHKTVKKRDSRVKGRSKMATYSIRLDFEEPDVREKTKIDKLKDFVNTGKVYYTSFEILEFIETLK